MRIYRRALTVIAAALMATPWALAGNDSKQVPFHADLEYTAAPSASSAPCTAGRVRIDITVTGGTITHLGRVTSHDYYACLNPLTLEFYGKYVFVGANGDSIDGAFQGRFVPTAEPGILLHDAHWSLDGGTGRFSGVTGSGTASGLGTPSGGHLTQDGTISSVGSA